MNKTLLATLVCFAPLGAAYSATTNITGTPYVGGDLTAKSGIETDANNFVISGEGDNPWTGNVSSLLVEGTVDLQGGINVGASDASSNGWLYVLQSFFKNGNTSFGLQSTGNMTLGTVIVQDGYGLVLSAAEGSNPDINIVADTNDGGAGAIFAAGDLSVKGFENILIGDWDTSAASLGQSSHVTDGTGTINSSGDLELRANKNIGMGSLSASGNYVDISAGGTVVVDGNMNFGGSRANVAAGGRSGYTISADAIFVDGDSTSGGVQGGIQNVSDIDLTITATSVLHVDGVIQNKGLNDVGGNMKLNAASIVAEAISNEYDDGELTITGGGLSLGGKINVPSASGSSDTIGASLVLNGSATINISGSTTLQSGWVLNNKNTNNSFSLTTGELTLGTDANLADMFTNTWDEYYLEIKNAGFTWANAANTDIVNNGGNMTIVAQYILANDVFANSGDLELLATGNNSDSYITVNAITVAEGANATISTTGTLTANDAVTNNGGNLTLGADTMVLGSLVSAQNGTTTAKGYNNQYGNITVNGDVVTETGGVLDMFASELTVKGLVQASGGTMTIKGNATDNGVNIGQIWVNGGVLNMDSFAGLIRVDDSFGENSDGTLRVDSGALNFGGNLVGVTVTNNIDIAGDITLSANSAAYDGDVNIAGTGAGFVMTSSNGTISIGGGITAEDTVARRATFVSDSVSVGGDVSAAAGGHLTFGTTDSGADSILNVTGELHTGKGGIIDVYQASTMVADVTGAGTFYLYGSELTAQGGVDIDGGLYFDGKTVTGMSGIYISNAAKEFTLTAADKGVSLGGDMSIAGGNKLTLSSTGDIFVGGDVTVDGDLIQGSLGGGALNLTQSGMFTSNGALTLNGDFRVEENNVDYTFNNGANISGDLLVSSGATASLATPNGTIEVTNVTNNGELTLSGVGLNASGDFTTNGMIYQNIANKMFDGAVNIADADYAIRAANISATGIEQASGTLRLTTNTLNITRDIGVEGMSGDVIVSAINSSDLLTVTVGGSVYGGTDFLGLKSMHIAGNYYFDNNSKLSAWIDANRSTGYWSTVNTEKGEGYGEITNQSNGEALITVGGQFITDLDLGIGRLDRDMLNGNKLPSAPGALGEHQVGITITDILDRGDAIWLVHAGVSGDEAKQGEEWLKELGDKMRNLYVQFCNFDGSICYNYYDSIAKAGTLDPDKLPAYISFRDTDGDGINDSIYIVFDPDFGGPVEVFKIQPIVDAEAGRTQGEYEAAGALDDLIEGKLAETGFFNRTPIEVIPLIFKGTNMNTLMQELYNRMEYYSTSFDGAPLEHFSRLVQPREIEQIAGSIILNEHTTFRDFEDRMYDEFIWNRHRNLRKAWADVSFGMFNQSVTDGKRVDGNRFSIAGGFDWQESPTLILGLTAHLSHMSGDNSDAMDLSYSDVVQRGHVDVSVANTNFGLGGYLMKNLGTKTRVYGNAFLDMHFLDVSREMTYMPKLEGDGTAFSVISEWGLMHDWLNQYIVGNLYARIGYNFGFGVTESAWGQDYMKLESDGYMILTPGYSLTAQKRIYPSAWLQIRPYASIGVEYDVVGAPDTVRYKFAPALRYTDYAMDVDPLWANIGGGIEVLSVIGAQVGVDFRYQYNSEIQLYNIKVSGSYRF